MIDVLIPMLGRAERVEPLTENLLVTSDDLVQRIVFICSPSDTEVIAEAQRVANHVFTICSIMREDHATGDFAKKINGVYSLCTSPYALLGASDLVFHPGWATEAIRVALDTGAGVIGTNDLGNAAVMAGRHSTHPLVSRAYIDERGGTLDRQPGVVLCDLYGHQNCDTELVTLAKARKTFAFAEASHVEHLHPFWHKGEMDDVYRKGQASSRADSRLYRQRLRMLSRKDP